METASESTEPFGDDPLALPAFDELELSSASAAAIAEPGIVEPALRRPARSRSRTRGRARTRLSAAARQELLWICVIYLAAHVALLIAAFLQASLGHHAFQNEISNWDGMWYRELANKGYPSYVSYAQTTLGFFPLFSLAIWPVSRRRT